MLPALILGEHSVLLVTSCSVCFGCIESQAIAQGFQVSKTDNIVSGALVSTTKNNPQLVEPATADSTARLIGVIDKNPLIAISDSGKEAQVVLSGITSVLVSDINGPIHAGDKITASPIAGVGMLATVDNQIAGTASAKLNVATAQTRTITDTSGKSHTVHIGYVSLQVGVMYYRAPGTTTVLGIDTSTKVVTVSTLVSTGNITVNGHIITNGTIPAVAAGTAACASPTVSVSGNDTSGIITIAARTGCAASGTLATLTFASAFGAAPHIVLTPGGPNALTLGAYINDSTVSTTGFAIGTNTTPTDGATYKWNYIVLQ